MNKTILMGRLTADPNVKYTTGESPTAIASYTLAVDRRVAKGAAEGADFISIKAFGKNGEFAEKYLKKGMKLIITGHIQTGNYTNKDGQKVYTTEVVVESQEFAESKSSGNNGGNGSSGNHDSAGNDENGFMNIPDGIDEELPFN